MLCLVKYFSADIEQYMLGTRHGLLNSTFSRNQFMPSTFHGLAEAEVDPNIAISGREAVSLQSIGDTQGFVKCSSKTGCTRKTCKCQIKCFM